MKLDIRKLDLPWCDVLAGHTERRVRRGLERLGGRVGSVLVQLADAGRTEDRRDDGSAHKHCQVAARLTTGHEISADGLDACAFRAVDGAVGRLESVLAERLLREQARRRSTA